MLAGSPLVVGVAVLAGGADPRRADIPAAPVGVHAMEPDCAVGVDYRNRPLGFLRHPEHDEVLDNAGGAGRGRCCHVEQVT